MQALRERTAAERRARGWLSARKADATGSHTAVRRVAPQCAASQREQSSRAVAVAAESRAGCNAQHHDATHRAARATHPVALLGVLQALGRVPRALLALADGSHTARLHADADFAPPPTARVTAFRQRRAVVVQVRNRFRCMPFF